MENAWSRMTFISNMLGCGFRRALCSVRDTERDRRECLQLVVGTSGTTGWCEPSALAIESVRALYAEIHAPPHETRIPGHTRSRVRMPLSLAQLSNTCFSYFPWRRRSTRDFSGGVSSGYCFYCQQASCDRRIGCFECASRIFGLRG